MRYLPPSALSGSIAVAGLGGAVLAAGIKTIISPVTFLTADAKGITAYAGVSASKWNSKTRSFERTRRRGDACLIPWNMISDIKEGTIETPVNPRTGKPNGLTLGGTITGYGSQKRHVARTLEILCDPSVKLDEFETAGFSIVRNGYQEGDLLGMSKAEREGLKPEDFLSCFILGSTGMNVRTAVAIETLKRMQAQHPTS